MASESKDRAGRTQAIGAVLPKVAGETLGRRGFAEGAIFGQWRDIVGADLAADCLPEKLAFVGGRRSDGTLHILAASGAALELQHRTEQILARVNSYLGYGAVARVRIRQGRLPERRQSAILPATDDTDDAADPMFATPALGTIADPKLKEALTRFGRSVRRHENAAGTSRRRR
ncbi:MAG: DUF721 domain-containing protein [Rhodospirillaceae bacterium]|nr:DUF721 domain-containing protein [Rhodospirillaceae bacterium]